MILKEGETDRKNSERQGRCNVCVWCSLSLSLSLTHTHTHTHIHTHTLYIHIRFSQQLNMKMSEEGVVQEGTLQGGRTPEEAEEVGIRLQALDELVSVNSFFTAAVFIGLSQSNDRSLVAKGPTDPCYAPTHLLRELVLLEVLAFSCFLMSSLVAQGLKLHLTLCRLCCKWQLLPPTYGNSNVAAGESSTQQHTELVACTQEESCGRTEQETLACAQKPTQACTHNPEKGCGRTGQPTLVCVHNTTGGHIRPAHQGCVRFLRLGLLATSLGSLCGTAFLLLSMIIIIQLRLGLLSCDSYWSKFATVPLVLLVSFGVLVFASAVYVAFRS
ncbi:hypothetical protein GOP47_0020425 [Adiantum capillus-veneris]|uniref:Transmembrane protein n=1 Tax=Adiantum capillus-veneris TaxID=13818 RepID=A0A9D4UDE3_ADICA|nr:hypothetical protein GOP47_0020425 [Adiantum capillus-veneris]